MSWTIYLCGSGTAFFLGIGLILVGLACFVFSSRSWIKAPATLAALIGLISIACSSTPLPYWLYALTGTVTVVWLVAERSKALRFQDRRNGLRWVVGIVWIVAAAIELPYHFSPTISPAGRPTVYVVGDSISAGINDHDEVWPHILQRQHAVDVTNFSRVGADVRSSLRQAGQLPPAGGLVLVEIGGNDLLGGTPAGQFEQGLDHLLGQVCLPGRTVVMFELPLPPFCNDYGLAQRRLAAKYHVALIPKRILIGVLSGEDATLDSIHPTKRGHEQMAEAVWAVIRGVYGE